MSESLSVCEIFSSIQGEGFLAGRRQIFVRLTECNLDCRYCDTQHNHSDTCLVETRPGSGQFKGLPQPLLLNTLLETLTEWKNMLPGAHHSASFTGGEPLLSVESLVSLLPRVREILPVHLETNGTMHVALEQVIKHIDYISMDIKLPSTSGCTSDLWELHRRFLAVATGAAVSVKIVVGDETPFEEIDMVVQILSGAQMEIPLFLQPMTMPLGGVGISGAYLLSLHERAAAKLADVRVIPQMHKLLGVA